jgi:hypothetical protein
MLKMQKTTTIRIKNDSSNEVINNAQNGYEIEINSRNNKMTTVTFIKVILFYIFFNRTWSNNFVVLC